MEDDHYDESVLPEVLNLCILRVRLDLTSIITWAFYKSISAFSYSSISM